MATKVSRKELLKKDDAFLNAANQGAQWIGSHRTQVIAGSIATIAAIFAIWGSVEYVGTRDAEASLLFEKGLALLDGQVLPEGSTDAPDPEGDPATFASEEDKWTAARGQFEKVAAKGGGVATLARFMVADLHEKLGETDAARAAFEGLAGDLSNNDTLAFVAIERAAYLHEGKGDSEAALRLLARLTNVEKGFYADQATFHQARLYLAKGETDRARNLLERIQQDFPESSVLDKVRDQLGALPPKPAAPEAAAPAPEKEAPAAAGEEKAETATADAPEKTATP